MDTSPPLLARARTAAREDGPLLVICGVLLVLGVWIRCQHLGYPPVATWDEFHFVQNAQRYVAGQPDTNDHPPLGKLLIAASIRLGADTAGYWRLVPLLAGLGTLLLGFWGCLRLWGPRTALIAAALLAADGFLVVYSRTALLDGMLTFFILATGLMAWRMTRWWQALLACVLLGLAVSIKVSGIVGLVPVVVGIAHRRRFRWLLLLGVVPLIYYLQFALGFFVTSLPVGPSAVIEKTIELWRHHASLTEWTHRYVSHWYTWSVPMKPIWMHWARDDNGMQRALLMAGNPALWWTVSASVVVVTFALLWRCVRLLGGSWRQGPLQLVRVPLEVLATPRAWVVMMFWLPIVPWVLSARDSYLYHYLPAYAAGVLLVAHLIGALYRWRAAAGLACLVVVLLVAAYYAPMMGALELSEVAMDRRLMPWWK